ncbi:MAG TPA: CoA transferase [Steroidobacteraceae bacterium]|jgi:crotonobetainyl-CoA:carnitine CoA-transferase CaiB-like acyl-CoA transferase
MSVLKGIRVLDFGRYVAGPYCATLLGYLGAEVIRVERIGGGEDRFIAPVTDAGEGAVLLQTGCNKRSLALELKDPRARQIVQRLVAGADVVVANLPPATLSALGLDYSALRAVRPDIILVTQSAFGDAGPYKDRGGFDGVGQAMSGAMYITGTPGAPAKAAAPYVDYTTAVLAAFGTLAAIMHRSATGEGQEVKTTLLGTALSVFGSHLIEQSVTGINRQGSGNRVQTSAPSDVFATRDGHVLTHTVGDALFKRWARLVGEEQRWISDPRYATDQSRGDHSADILTRMRAWCAERSSAEALAELTAAGLPAGPVLTPQQVLDDPQVAAMKFLKPVAGYPGLARPAQVSDLPVSFGRIQAGITQGPPTAGEHSREILAALGLSAGEIASLFTAGVVA